MTQSQDEQWRAQDQQWRDDIFRRFPDWDSDAALLRWPETRSELAVGQTVVGRVVSRAPFGVWLDIGVGFPALLLVTNMQHANERRISPEEYPEIGALVEGRINALGDRGEIGLTQLDHESRRPARKAAAEKIFKMHHYLDTAAG